MKRIPSHIFYPLSALLYFLFGLPVSLSQTKPATDTTKESSRGVDTVVVYSASDSITYSLSNRVMNLYGKADLKYR